MALHESVVGPLLLPSNLALMNLPVTHSSVDGHLTHFSFLATVNKVAVNIPLQGFFFL